jgi:hypothetical protein
LFQVDSVSYNCTVVKLKGSTSMSTSDVAIRTDTSRRWPLERVLFALAGTMTLLSAALAAAISPWFLLLTAFVGVNQWLYVLVGACPASILLRRAFHLRSALYADPGPDRRVTT